MVLGFPQSSWPPTNEIVLASNVVNEALVKLLGDPLGRLGVQIESGSTEWFGPIVMSGDVRVVISVVFDAFDMHVQINTNKLPPWMEAQEPLELSGTTPVESPILSIDPFLGETKEETLFLNTIRDIQLKLLDGSAYSIIKASGLLRLLFLDGQPLVHRVNRRFHLPLRFETSDFRTMLPLEPDMHWISLDASGLTGENTLQISLTEFLHACCLNYKSLTAKVIDVISVAAHVKGGIHFGNPKTEGEELVCSLDEIMTLAGEDVSLVALKSICTVAIKGLEPLVHAIQSKK